MGIRSPPARPSERMVFDIDPNEGLAFADVKRAAIDTHDVLGSVGLQSWSLLSGGKGIHVVVPLVPEADYTAAKTFARTSPSFWRRPSRIASLPR